MEPFLVVVMRSCRPPRSVASVGWYPTAEGMRPRRADTSELACTATGCIRPKRAAKVPSDSDEHLGEVGDDSQPRTLQSRVGLQGTDVWCALLNRMAF